MQNKIWFARSETFNDPFDSKPPVNFVTYEAFEHLVTKCPDAWRLNKEQLHNVVQLQVDEAKEMIAAGRIKKSTLFGRILSLLCSRYFADFFYLFQTLITTSLCGVITQMHTLAFAFAIILRG